MDRLGPSPMVILSFFFLFNGLLPWYLLLRCGSWCSLRASYVCEVQIRSCRQMEKYEGHSLGAQKEMIVRRKDSMLM